MKIPILIMCAALVVFRAVPAVAADDFRDVAVIAATVKSALETRRTGTTIEWSNPTTGNTGEITITRTWYRPDGAPCREYRRTTRRKGAADGVVTGTGCRDNRAAWKLSEKVVETKSAATESKPPDSGNDAQATPDGWNDPAADKQRAPAGPAPDGWNDPAADKQPATETARVTPGPDNPPPAIAPPPDPESSDDKIEPPPIAKPPPPRKKPLVVTGSIPSRSDD